MVAAYRPHTNSAGIFTAFFCPCLVSQHLGAAFGNCHFVRFDQKPTRSTQIDLHDCNHGPLLLPEETFDFACSSYLGWLCQVCLRAITCALWFGIVPVALEHYVYVSLVLDIPACWLQGVPVYAVLISVCSAVSDTTPLLNFRSTWGTISPSATKWRQCRNP